MLSAQPLDHLVQSFRMPVQRREDILVLDHVMPCQHLAGRAAQIAELAHIAEHLHGGNRHQQILRRPLARKHARHGAADFGQFAQMHFVKQREPAALPPLRFGDAGDFRRRGPGGIVWESDRVLHGAQLQQGFASDVNCATISLAAKNAYIPDMTQALDDIIADFELLDDWEDRYRYIIDLGRSLAPLPDLARTEGNKVQGCVSQVWLQTSAGEGPDPLVHFLGDSDAHIVKGLVAIILALYSGRRASEISATDAEGLMKQLGLDQHISPQRSNGIRAMVARIRRDGAATIKGEVMH